MPRPDFIELSGGTLVAPEEIVLVGELYERSGFPSPALVYEVHLRHVELVLMIYNDYAMGSPAMPRARFVELARAARQA